MQNGNAPRPTFNAGTSGNNFSIGRPINPINSQNNSVSSNQPGGGAFSFG